MSKDEVVRVREELLQQVEVAKVGAEGAKAGAEAAKAGGEATAKLKRKRSTDQQSKTGKESSAAEVSSTGVIDEDAPKGSMAHDRVKRRNKGVGAEVCCFKFVRGDGTKEHFQTTMKAANNSMENAMRIARLCYAKFEAGATKAEVEQFRGEMYAKCSGHNTEEGGGKQKKIKSNGTASILEQLRETGRMAGAIRLEGRDPTAKNASINGIYAHVSGGFAGASAYEKIGGHVPRFLFYSARKKRWLVNDELDDAKTGFAYAKTKDGGKATPPEHGTSLQWFVFGGKAEGYREDPAVRCELLADGAKTKPEPGRKPAGSKVKGRDAAKAEGEEGVEGDASSAQSESDDEDSVASGSKSSSSSSSGSDAEKLPSGAGPAVPLARAPTAQVLVHKSIAKATGRVCAKMLVNSGLRCPCHFAYRRECPSMARALVA